MMKLCEGLWPTLLFVRHGLLRRQFALLIAMADVHLTFDVHRLGRGRDGDAADFAPVDFVEADFIPAAVLAPNASPSRLRKNNS